VLLTYDKPVAFEFFSGVVYGGDCPLGCIAVVASYCSSSGWTTFGWCFSFSYRNSNSRASSP